MFAAQTLLALCLSALGILLCAAGIDAQAPAPTPTATPMPTPLNLMPYPSQVEMGSGFFRIDPSVSIIQDMKGHQEARLERAIQRFAQHLAERTGMPANFLNHPIAGRPNFLISTQHGSKDVQELGEDESYVLEVKQGGVTLTARTPLGTMHGLQTFLQLVEVTPDGFAAPAVTIHDQPRFPWRGLMIDSGRHFIPMNVLKRNLDGLEAVKMNVFHWHLSENQGFRVESKKFPKLHQLGSDRLYYTQDEVRDLIAYARDRGIRVVPEFDMPGHSTAWFVGYPELASGPGPYEIERRWGVFDPAMDPTNDKTYKFLDELIAEMAKLFPDHYFHIGGDEVNGKQWDANPKIQEFKKSHKLASNADLQGYFSKRLQAIVTKHGKSVVGWDEVFIPGVPKDIVIQSWRGQSALAQAASQGYRGILSNGYYIDLGWSAARHYTNDPLSASANLTPEQQKLVLGGESTMWSEYVNAENIDSRIWPRNAAIAERLWSPQNVTDVPSMYARLDVIGAQLEWLGLTHRNYYRRMLQRIAGAATPEEFTALRILTDVVEPVKEYGREKLAPAEPTSLTPMNRLVDAAPLESAAARHFSNTVDKFLAAQCKDAVLEAKLRAQFTQWRENDAKLQPLAQRSFLVKEVVQTSTDLSALGAAGLAALDNIAKGTAAPDQWKAQQTAAIQEIQKPKAQLLIIPAAAVQKLIDAASTGGACSQAR
jgi:hexosaminidase